MMASGCWHEYWAQLEPGRYIVMVVMYPGESGRHGLVVGNSRQAGHGWRLESGWVPWMHRVWLEW